MAKGETVNNVLKNVLKKRLGTENIIDIKQKLLGIYGKESETYIQALLTSSNANDFSKNVKNLIDLQAGPELSYEQSTIKATEEYKKLLVSK